jgi:hypothetical protein
VKRDHLGVLQAYAGRLLSIIRRAVSFGRISAGKPVGVQSAAMFRGRT